MLGALVVIGVIGSVLVFMAGGRTDASAGPAAAPVTSAAAPVTSAAARTPAVAHTTSAPRKPPPRAPRGPTKATHAPADDSPSAGNGVFDTAQASGESVGSGRIRRYEVQVEEGTGVSTTAAAKEIAGILADPRSWTADGHDGFQLVSDGPHDFDVKIASPPTVDRICGAAGLHTHGEVNCDVDDQVIVNLKRWNNGSPQFPGPLREYRALIINHEVGHRIGHGHEGCPGPGRPAPAMMQQIDGLHGCLANAWPYNAEGTYLSGPPMP